MGWFMVGAGLGHYWSDTGSTAREDDWSGGGIGRACNVSLAGNAKMEALTSCSIYFFNRVIHFYFSRQRVHEGGFHETLFLSCGCWLICFTQRNTFASSLPNSVNNSKRSRRLPIMTLLESSLNVMTTLHLTSDPLSVAVSRLLHRNLAK